MLALLSSALWGTGDFLGGSLSRRAHPLLVLRATQSVALLGMVLVVVLSGSFGGSLAYAPYGIGAGAAGLIGLFCFYGALATGTMGVVAPIAGLGVIVPVAVGLGQGDAPTGPQIAGIVVAVLGALLVSGPERSEVLDRVGRAKRRRPLLLAVLAAVGFGLTFAFVAEGSDTSTIMTVATMRMTNVVLSTIAVAVLIRRRSPPGGLRRADAPTVVTIAVTDTTAAVFYGLATTSTLLSLAAVLGSLYPAVTALLAWRFHRERLKREQVVGVALTLLGVAAITAG
jgi:drug/metabolite transporter (DMT)-like permease